RAAKGRQLARIKRCSARACRIHCALRCRQDLVHCKSDEYIPPNDECGEQRPRGRRPMIHHLSIAARDPQHVAEQLAQFIGGAATRFTPNPGSWFAHQQDEHGTGVEVYPAGPQLRPAGPEGAGFAMTEPIRPGYSATHFALSVPMSQEQIAAIAEREDWQC